MKSTETGIIFSSALRDNTLRLANYGLMEETEYDWTNIELAQAYVSYCVQNEEFLKDLIDYEIEEYGMGRMSNFHSVFLLNFLSFDLQLEDSLVMKIEGELIKKEPKILSKDEALKLYMMKVFVDGEEIELKPYFDIIFSTKQLEILSDIDPEINEAFVRGLAFNSVKFLHHGLYDVMKVEDRVELATDYLTKMITFEKLVKEDMTDLWKEGGDNEEKSWIGFMAYKYLCNYDLPDEVASLVGTRLMDTPTEQPTPNELALLMKTINNLVGPDPRYDLGSAFVEEPCDKLIS